MLVCDKPRGISIGFLCQIKLRRSNDARKGRQARMDKVADFYERWFATKRIPDYSGVESASEELAKQLLGVYESEKRDFWQSCGVQFLRGTILHLSSQAHMRGEETMTVRHLIEFLEADPVEKSWEQLIASQPGDEQIRWLAFRAGEFMVNNPPPVAAA